MPFPDIVYRSPGLHHGPPGKTYSFLGVADESELAAALAAGWSRTLPEACEDKPAPVVAPVVEDAAPTIVVADDAPPTREELKAKAAALGLDFDGRISDAKLIKLIDDAIAAQE